MLEMILYRFEGSVLFVCTDNCNDIATALQQCCGKQINNFGIKIGVVNVVAYYIRYFVCL